MTSQDSNYLKGPHNLIHADVAAQISHAACVDVLGDKETARDATVYARDALDDFRDDVRDKIMARARALILTEKAVWSLPEVRATVSRLISAAAEAAMAEMAPMLAEEIGKEIASRVSAEIDDAAARVLKTHVDAIKRKLGVT